ncbi:hypothetical protein EJP82_11360 [Paenibacillus anaericanus]|uniref:Uncharacterized protein n=1 Tax=Paenibacillus anaericanus TaxID=170367 RepID=A0A3S1DQ37_9BACL|nr:hypothetical protein [Paenibacillus anaericanus]RUT46444.1 hypothetical protein EJP82_11360 [Paenibacillus anaericanus]
MQVGRDIFYDKITGIVILDTGEYDEGVRRPTVDEQIAIYNVLSSRSRASFDVVSLEYQELQNDFRQCDGYHVDDTTKQIVFRYPGGAPEDPQPFQPSLSAKMTELEDGFGALLLENATGQATIAGLEGVVAGLLFEVAMLKGGK